MSISDKLTLLASTKEAQRVKLGLGVEVPFASYVNSLNPVWSVLDVFKTGSEGVWYDPSDLSTLFQDAAGTIPVTANGDPVGKMLDKSGNHNHAIQDVSSRRVAYQTDGILHKLVFDGVDDSFASSAFSTVLTQPFCMTIAVKAEAVIGDFKFIFDSTIPNRLAFLFEAEGKTEFGAGLTVSNNVLKDKLKAVYQLKLDGANSILYRDNRDLGAGNAGLDGMKDVLLGRIENSPTYGNPKMDFYGMVLAKGMTGVDEYMIKDYLAKKAGVAS